MENQVAKFVQICAVFDILVYDVGFDSINVRKGDLEINIGKWLLINDYHLIRMLLEVYSEFRENEQKKARETQWQELN